MTDSLVLDLVEKNLLTDQIVLTIGYDIENLTGEKRRSKYHGEVTVDHYGRAVPKNKASVKYPVLFSFQVENYTHDMAFALIYS